MQKSPLNTLIYAAIVLFCQWVAPGAGHSGWFGPDTLVTIDGESYTTEDFKSWWQYWKEDGMSFPETPDPYIDWLLLVREAKSMELDQDPEVRQKLLTFLKVRGLMLLKGEEVDSRIKLSNDDLRQRYTERYTPRWLVSLFFFKDESAAQAFKKAVEDGKVDIEDMKEDVIRSYEIVQLQKRWFRPENSGKKTGQDSLLEHIKGLKKGETGGPFKWERL